MGRGRPSSLAIGRSPSFSPKAFRPFGIPVAVTPPAAVYMQALVGLDVTNLAVANVN